MRDSLRLMTRFYNRNESLNSEKARFCRKFTIQTGINCGK